MPNTFTTKFRLCKPEAGILDWHLLYYDAMNIVDAHVPRIFMSAPRIITIATSAGGTLTANWYYFYKVLAMNGTLITMASWEDTSAHTDVTNKTVGISWSAVVGVTKYRVYRADTNDPAYVPVDGDYNLLAEVTGSASYSDTGSVVPGGAMPSSPTWYTTEIDQLYLIGDTTEGQTQHVTPATLVDNLDNVRYMINQINGQTNWDDALVTNLYKLQNGKSGGQQVTGGTGASENLTLRSTAHATKGTIFVDSDIAGSALASGNLTLRSTTHATKGTIISDSVLNMSTHKIINVVDPSNAQEVATKKYVDDFLSSGGIDYCDTFPAATPGATVFDTSAAYVLGGKNLHVYVDGVLMTFTDDYAETSTTRITFVQAMTGGEKVSLVWKAGSAVGNADTVDGINASATPTANMLMALDGSAKFPVSVMPTAFGYIDRGDPASYDFNTGDFITDNTWRDLDLSSIVPSGAKAVNLRINIQDDLLGVWVGVRKNGNLHTANVGYVYIYNVAVPGEAIFIVPCDENRVIEYIGYSTTFTDIKIQILGWLI